MSIVILSCIFLLFSFSSISAYSFSSYMDIKDLPLNLNEENAIYYNEEKVYDNGNILSIPPETAVAFGIDGNFTDGLVVDTYTFLSKGNIYQGDLTKFFDSDSIPFSNIFFFKNYTDYQRYGKMVSMEDVVLSNGRNDLFSLTVNPPLEVLEYTYTIGNGVVEVQTTVKNSIDIILYDIAYTHDIFSETRDFGIGEQYSYEYILEYDVNEEYLDLGYPSIYNPNTRKYCAAGSNTEGNHHNIFLTEDNIYIYPDKGTQEEEDFCITQIRYTLNLGRIEVGERPKEEDQGIEGKETIKNYNVNSGEENIEDILGISVLPKTGSYSFELILVGVFLVAFGILCYYFTNENSIRDT